jgi:hypothetical protein
VTWIDGPGYVVSPLDDVNGRRHMHELRLRAARRPFTEPDIPATKSRLDKGIRAETVLNWPGKWSEWQDLNLRPLRPER